MAASSNMAPAAMAKLLKRLASADVAGWAASVGLVLSLQDTMSNPSNVPSQARAQRQLIKQLQAALCRGWSLLLPEWQGNLVPALAAPPAIRTDRDELWEATLAPAINLTSAARQLAKHSSAAAASWLEPRFLQAAAAFAAALAGSVEQLLAEAQHSPGKLSWATALKSASGNLLNLWAELCAAAQHEPGAPRPRELLQASPPMLRLALAAMRCASAEHSRGQGLLWHPVNTSGLTACTEWVRAAGNDAEAAQLLGPDFLPALGVLLACSLALCAGAEAAGGAASSSRHAGQARQEQAHPWLQPDAVPPHAAALAQQLGLSSAWLVSSAQQNTHLNGWVKLFHITRVVRVLHACCDRDYGLMRSHLALLDAMPAAAGEACCAQLRLLQQGREAPADSLGMGRVGQASLSLGAASDLLCLLCAVARGGQAEEAAHGSSRAAAASSSGSSSRPARDEQRPAEPAAAMLARILELLLQQLLPALWAALSRQQEPEAELVEEMGKAMLLLPMAAADAGPAGEAVLRAALLRQRPVLVPLLELAMRQQVHAQLLAALGEYVLRLPVWQPAAPGEEAPMAAALAADASRSARVFSLLLTALKAAQAGPQAMYDAYKLPVAASYLWPIGCGFGSAADALVPGAHSGSEGVQGAAQQPGARLSSGAAPWRREWPGLLGSPLVPWMVLVARGLEAAGRCWPARDWPAREQAAALELVAAKGRAVLANAGEAARWLGDALHSLAAQQAPEGAVAGPAGHASAMQRLAQQCRSLAARLAAWAASSRGDEPAGASSSSAAAALTAEQAAGELQALAAGVLGQLPLPLCCNNAACRSLAQASELALVEVGLPVCARCRVARYCSRECQLAAWPGHKQMCAQLAAAAGRV